MSDKPENLPAFDRWELSCALWCGLFTVACIGGFVGGVIAAIDLISQLWR